MEYFIAENVGQLLIRLVLLAVLSFTGLSATKAALVFGISDLLLALHSSTSLTEISSGASLFALPAMKYAKLLPMHSPSGSLA